MRHPPCALCEGLDTCRFLDCQEAIPEGHTLCWHCEAALAEDFAPDGPDDVFSRTPEPWGGRHTPGHQSSRRARNRGEGRPSRTGRRPGAALPRLGARGGRRERTTLPGASWRRSHSFLTKNTLLSVSVHSSNPTQFLVHFLSLLATLAPLARHPSDNHLFLVQA